MRKLKSLSIFYPSLNDAKILPYLVVKTYQVATIVAEKFEIIIINDGSKDDTKQVLDHLQKMYKNVKAIHHTRNRGYGGALNTGFKNSKFEWVFYTDGDGQYNPMELLLLVKALRGNTNVVNGYKRSRKDAWHRKIIGSLYNTTLQTFYELPISDIDCDFRLIKRSLLKNVTLTTTSATICLELILKLKQAGAHFREVGVTHRERLLGRSQFFSMGNLMKTLTENIKFYKGWTNKPVGE